MSMMSTLSKIAIGVMVARTVGKAVTGGSSGGGGLGDIIGNFLGGSKSGNSSNAQGNRLPDLLNQLGGDRENSSVGDLLSNLLSGKSVEATPTQEEKAEILLKAILNAAKADGVIDEKEKAKIEQHIGEVSQEELAIVKEALNSPLDIEGFINEVPKGMEQQVYLMSLMAIDLDTQEEAQYLDRLAKGLNISPEMANAIHERVGAPKLYS